MPITLNDYASLVEDQGALGLYKMLYRMPDILTLFPVVEVGAFTVHGAKWDTLPTGDFRKLNASFSDSTGTITPAEERLAIFGSKFTEDEAYGQSKVKLYQDPVDLQWAMHMKAVERQIVHAIINGDIDSDPDGINGLVERLGDTAYFAAGQTISASGSSDSLKVLNSATTAKQFFDKVDEAIYAANLWGSSTGKVPKGVLLMNKTSYLGIQQAARLASYSIYQENYFDKKWWVYRGIPLIDVGLQRDRSTEIIGDAYDPGDGGNDASRIFAVRFAEPDQQVDSPGSDGLTIVQAGGIRKLGPVETLTTFEHGVEWIMGLCHIGDDTCLAMLDDFKMASS